MLSQVNRMLFLNKTEEEDGDTVGFGPTGIGWDRAARDTPLSPCRRLLFGPKEEHHWRSQ
jgi:hypothetical protein